MTRALIVAGTCLVCRQESTPPGEAQAETGETLGSSPVIAWDTLLTLVSTSNALRTTAAEEALPSLPVHLLHLHVVVEVETARGMGS